MEFEIEYGNSIDEFLESIYLAGADLGGSKLENYARSIERSNKMLTLLNSAVDLMRSKHKFGEQYYWILYYTFLSPQQRNKSFTDRYSFWYLNSGQLSPQKIELLKLLRTNADTQIL